MPDNLRVRGTLVVKGSLTGGRVANKREVTSAPVGQRGPAIVGGVPASVETEQTDASRDAYKEAG